MSMPIEAKRGVVVSMGCFSGCCGIVFEDYPRGGSSRSIPLADVTLVDIAIAAHILKHERTCTPVSRS
jgi:hypothetical protein